MSFRWVLVEPQHGGNVGAVARVLKNLGWQELVLVSPNQDPRNDEAFVRAVDAEDLLSSANWVQSLEEALAGATHVIGTSRRRGRQRKPHDPFDETLQQLIPEISKANATTAILFGREAHGLSDEELDRCTHLAYFPASEAYPSFNLSHAVALAAYELRKQLPFDHEQEPGDCPELADHNAKEDFFSHWERALLGIGYLHDHTATAMMRRFRRLFGRTGLTSEDLAMLRGLARQIEWAAKRHDKA